MPRHSRSFQGKLPELNFVLLVVMLVVLWIAGGASRADVFGQTVVRAVAWLVAIIAILFAPKPNLKPVAPVAYLLFASVTLVVLQLIPLPPSLWTALPGRDLLAQTARVSGQPQPWRPISLSPGATINALTSLVVPVLVLFLMAGLRPTDRGRSLPLVLTLIVSSSLVGLLQFSGSRFDNPFINELSGYVSGIFANRNHYALFLACGCVLAPAWAFQSSKSAHWKAIAAVAMVVVFVLMILASGSRTGIFLGVAGAALGIFSVRGRIKRRILQLPRRIRLAVLSATVGLFFLALVMSIVLNRAISLDRVIALDAAEDLRAAAMPVVWKMVGRYWPIGSGFGAFDPIYRIHEPNALLSIFYFNHAHNDWLEIVLDGGVPTLVLALVALTWWARASVRAWRFPLEVCGVLPRIGSSVLLLIAIASVVDYPARTPMVMALVSIAAAWLCFANQPHHTREIRD